MKELSRLFDLSSDLVVIGGLDGRPKEMSSAWTKVLGWSREELLATSAPELIHPDDLQRTMNALEKAVAGDDISRFENRYRHKSGGWVWLSWVGFFSAEEQSIYALARDISAFRRMEEKLEQCERHLSETQKIAKMGSWSMQLTNRRDLDANTLSWSDEVFRIFGYQPGEIEASNEVFFDAVHPQDRAKIRAAIDEAIRTGKDYDIEHRIFLPDGTERIVHERSRISYDERTGQALSMSGTVQDITEQKELMKQLIAAQKMDSIGRLAGGIAHDFNNILAVIYGNLEVMEQSIAPDHPAFQNLKSIETTSRRAAELTGQLLSFSRSQRLAPKLHDLNELVREAVRMLTRVIGENIKVELHLEPNLKAVEVDSGQIIQIVLNLAINARDAMPNGGILRIATSLKESHVRLTVGDTGHGMDTATQEKIFEPFFTTKTSGRGTGLGLPTVYGIVKQSGGAISVTSTPGIGTVFEILLPASAKPLPKPVAVEAGGETLASQVRSILLVEDEKDVLSILKAVLEKKGYRVFTAESGRIGVETFESHFDEIELLITDMVLPGLSGVEVIKRVRELNPDLPVICITGYAPEDASLSNVPDLTVLRKPFSFSQLIERIETFGETH